MKRIAIIISALGFILTACASNPSTNKEIGMGWEHSTPAAPTAGSWKPVDFPDGSKYTIDPPPANDSETTLLEIEELKELAINRTEEDIRIIRRWSSDIYGPNSNWFIATEEMLGKYMLAPPEAARVHHIVAGAIYTASVAAFDQKYLYLRPRPTHLDSELALIENFEVPAHPAYPSAHATTGWAASTVLSYMFPNDKQTFVELAEESDLSRKLAGVHYESDNEAGRNLGKQVAQDIIDGLKDDNAPLQYVEVMDGMGH